MQRVSFKACRSPLFFLGTFLRFLKTFCPKRCLVGLFCAIALSGGWAHNALAQQAFSGDKTPSAGTSASATVCLSPAECLQQLRFAESALLRQQAAQVLGERGSTTANSALIMALQNDPSEFVKIKAVQALGRLRMPRSFEPLVNTLNQAKSGRLRVAAALALGEAQMVKATLPLQNTLKKDAHWRVRRAAAFALGRFNQSQHVSTLLTALQSEPHPLVRFRIATVLQKIPFSPQQTLAAAPVLIKGFEAEKNIQVRLAMIALQGTIGGDQIQQALLVLLSDKHVEVREAAVRALGDIPNNRTTQRLIQTLRDDTDLRIRQAALRALSKHKTAFAQEAIAYYAKHTRLKDLQNLAKDLLQKSTQTTPLPAKRP